MNSRNTNAASKLLLLSLFYFAMFLTSQSAFAEEKHALVIGNGSYRFGALKNPVNDARSVSQTLRQMGFKITELHNRNRKQMVSSIRQFGQSLRPGSVAVIYFSGHGAQYRGENFLFPTDFNTQFEEELAVEAIGTGFLMDKLRGNVNGLNILILDACRDNPLQRKFKSNLKGLARIENAPPNTFNIFATGPGQVASDNNRGNNGLFTKHLVKYMKQPGLDLAGMMIETRKQVILESKNTQIPYDSGSLTRRFCFAGCETAPSAAEIEAVRVAEERKKQQATEANRLAQLDKDKQAMQARHLADQKRKQAQLDAAKRKAAEQQRQLVLQAQKDQALKARQIEDERKRLAKAAADRQAALARQQQQNQARRAQEARDAKIRADSLARWNAEQEQKKRLSAVQIKTINTAQLVNLVTNQTGYTLVDTRESDDYALQHLIGSLSIPRNRFSQMANLLPNDKSRMLIFYCYQSSCDISKLAAEAAIRSGYTNIYRYVEGFNVWFSNGYKTHSSDDH